VFVATKVAYPKTVAHRIVWWTTFFDRHSLWRSNPLVQNVLSG